MAIEGGARLAMRQQPARIWVTSSGFAPGRGDGERARHRCQDGADLSAARPQRPGCPGQGELWGSDPAPAPRLHAAGSGGAGRCSGVCTVTRCSSRCRAVKNGEKKKTQSRGFVKVHRAASRARWVSIATSAQAADVFARALQMEKQDQ